MTSKWCVVACALALAGCAGLDPNIHADALATPADLTRQLVTTNPFMLTAFARISRPDKPLVIYIEGDGRAWQSYGEPSRDPTPRTALGLALAAADTSANVVYLARPCQFTARSLNPQCDETYWTGKRFAPEIIASMNQAIDHFAAQAPKQKIHLVGYSGGAAVAVLVAASRHDIASLRTVAGNLDTEGFNRYHDVSAMPDSLNPVDVAAHLASLPQEHFVGDEDDTVPPSLSAAFLQAMGDTHCATVTHVKEATHEAYWPEFWRVAASQLPVCH